MTKLEIKIGKREFAVSISLTAILCAVMAIIGYAITGIPQGAAVGFVLPVFAYISAIFGLIPFAGIAVYPIVYNMLVNWIMGATGLGATFAVPQLVFFWLYGITAVILCIATSLVAAIFVIGVIAAIASR